MTKWLVAVMLFQVGVSPGWALAQSATPPGPAVPTPSVAPPPDRAALPPSAQDRKAVTAAVER